MGILRLYKSSIFGQKTEEHQILKTW